MGAVDASWRQAELVEDLAAAVLGDRQYRLRRVQRGKHDPAMESIRLEVRGQRRRAVRDQVEAGDHGKRRRLQEEVKRGRVVDLRRAVEDPALGELGERLDGAEPERLERSALFGTADE